MSMGIAFILVVTSLLSSARSQTWTGHNQLHPVHGLYVKPSSDGTTGDLYVAATEDSGTKAQWLTDQPVNFLPATVATQAAVPVPHAAYPAVEESPNTQKHAVIASPAVEYAYLPFNPSEAYAYPYATSSNSESLATQSDKTAAAPAPVPYNPFHFFYPQMMSAYANAKSVLKESGISDEKAASVIPRASPLWANSYAYPPYPMYVMVDPAAWSQFHAAQSTARYPSASEITPK